MESTLTVYAPIDQLEPAFFGKELPAVLQQDVRSGRVKVLMRTLGRADAKSRSVTAAGLIQAAGLQDKMWQVLIRTSATADGVTPTAEVVEAAMKAEGVDVERARRSAASERAKGAVERGNELARSYGTDKATYTLSVDGGKERELSTDCPNCLVQDVQRQLNARGA